MDISILFFVTKDRFGLLHSVLNSRIGRLNRIPIDTSTQICLSGFRRDCILDRGKDNKLASYRLRCGYPRVGRRREDGADLEE